MEEVSPTTIGAQFRLEYCLKFTLTSESQSHGTVQIPVIMQPNENSFILCPNRVYVNQPDTPFREDPEFKLPEPLFGTDWRPQLIQTKPIRDNHLITTTEYYTRVKERAQDFRKTKIR